MTSDKDLPLIAPKYGKPVKVVKPKQLSHVREGRFCGQCSYFLSIERGREVIAQKKFWDHAFHAHDDGHDLKPYHFGNLGDYSVCQDTNGVVHFFAPGCKRFKKNTLIAKIMGKML